MAMTGGGVGDKGACSPLCSPCSGEVQARGRHTIQRGREEWRRRTCMSGEGGGREQVEYDHIMGSVCVCGGAE